MTMEEETQLRYEQFLDTKFEEWYKTLPYRCTNTNAMVEAFKAGWKEATRLAY